MAVGVAVQLLSGVVFFVLCRGGGLGTVHAAAGTRFSGNLRGDPLRRRAQVLAQNILFHNSLSTGTLDAPSQFVQVRVIPWPTRLSIPPS
jgi:hypothetical protein